VTETRTLAARKYSGGQATQRGNLSAPDGINASIKAMKAANLNPVLNGLGCVAELEELPERDHPMLAPDQRPDRRLNS